jgi:FkbM family methyltransferase
MSFNLQAIAQEALTAASMTKGVASRLRFAWDVIISRFLKFVRLPGYNQVRIISLQDGPQIAYRLNRGDIQGLREVWMDHCYELPFTMVPQIVVDLGANIGLTSLWLHHRFKCRQFIAVEALAGNAEVVRQNFALNHLPGTVIHAAIGPADGEVVFECQSESNVGRVLTGEPQAKTADRVKVKMISMDQVLALLPEGDNIDLIKLDIEGGEEALFSSNLGWLSRVNAIIAELHPDIADCDLVRRNIEAAGFKFIPPNSRFPGSVSAFIRSDHPAALQ